METGKERRESAAWNIGEFGNVCEDKERVVNDFPVGSKGNLLALRQVHSASPLAVLDTIENPMYIATVVKKRHHNVNVMFYRDKSPACGFPTLRSVAELLSTIQALWGGENLAFTWVENGNLGIAFHHGQQKQVGRSASHSRERGAFEKPIDRNGRNPRHHRGDFQGQMHPGCSCCTFTLACCALQWEGIRISRLYTRSIAIRWEDLFSQKIHACASMLSRNCQVLTCESPPPK